MRKASLFIVAILIVFASGYYLGSQTENSKGESFVSHAQPNSIALNASVNSNPKSGAIDMLQMLKDAKFQPVQNDGETSFVRVSRIKKGSVWDKMGLRDGDIIESINGQPPIDNSGNFRPAFSGSPEEWQIKKRSKD